MATTQEMHLAIGLPLRNRAELNTLLQQIYDPASPEYRHYVTADEFARRFGPTVADYQALSDFAVTNGLKVSCVHSNRMILDVRGSVADIERTFHVAMRVYHHPTEKRLFYAPDTDPALDAPIPVNDVSGLSDYGKPRHHYIVRKAGDISVGRINAGSGSGGTYIGNDFRAAYAPGVTLNGAGQSVALVQFDGYLASDIAAYESAAGLSGVTLTNILLDGFSGTPTGNGGEVEVSMDIELVIAMAPGLSKVIVYEGNPVNFIPNDVLNRIASDNSAKQVSCSWTWTGGPSATTDQIFLQMAAQGQSFFTASGDSDSYKNGAVDNASLFGYPAQSPYVTSVGGTVLTTTGPGGAYVSETVWNTRTWDTTRSAYVGSSGGISSYYAIPSWQQGVDMTNNGGSAANRNFPDVALTADNVFAIADNGLTYVVGGTSCAAPLWAGFMALVNQQAANFGLSPVGFLNPAIYSVGKGTRFSKDLRDTTTGDNTSPDLQNPNGSTNQFYAVAGYDLCTGWGSPAGSNLINDLAPFPDDLRVSPSTGLVSIGPTGGPFSPSNQVYSLTNAGNALLNWATMVSNGPWVSVSPSNGLLAAGATTNVAVSLNANLLLPGSYSNTVTFTNLTRSIGAGSARSIILTVTKAHINDFMLDVNPGWAIQGEWAFGTPTGGGGGIRGNPDPTSGATGTNVYGVNLGGNYSTAAGGPYYLTTGPLNCLNYTNVSLSFQRWLNSGGTPSTMVTVEISSNGTSWVTVFANGSSAIKDAAWTNCLYDMSSVADGQSNVFVRWGYQLGSGAKAYSGWNIDDIELLGIPRISLSGQVAPLGTPYSWLSQYGLTNEAADVEELLDSDGDGVPNWKEYIADTNPTNINSFFHVSAITNLPPWSLYVGTSTARLYILEYSTNLAMSNGWFGVGGQSNIWGTGSTSMLTDTNASLMKFYRVRVQLP